MAQATTFAHTNHFVEEKPAYEAIHLFGLYESPLRVELIWGKNANF